ncbi:hypothetical protein C2G38_2105582 [Gigaspora rosea]|uniref:TLDc domain-containing protein n=1 Tax=Gigaspora rosea TaxID=44941 RepID=A0A397UN94_9GLOM|nr:hypothetical protein C2G38_2105582 [Gigaspora rosea]
MFIAQEFLLEELVKLLETHLIEENAHWLRLNFNNIYLKSFQSSQFQKLQEWCNDIVVKYPSKIFDSKDFTQLQENILISLLKRDDLQIEEGKFWNYVIKWGIAQNSGLPSEPDDWTRENFQALKITLQNCLPLIRYFQISGNDIIDNVQPYHQILEKSLWKDIMKRIVNPNQQISSTILPPRVILTPNLPIRISETFSAVINEEHAAEIASWIDEKTTTYSIRNNPYEFRLLLRGSKDGFTANSFWNLCDKKKDVVVVIKVKGTDEILGGYNPIGFDKSVYGPVSCDKCFIFSLKNGNIQNSILSRVKTSSVCAIYNEIDCGPQFYYDLVTFNSENKSFCYRKSYEKSIRNVFVNSHGFSLEEYEIFQIYKKQSY